MRALILTALFAILGVTTAQAQAPDYVSHVWLKYLGRLPNPSKHAYWVQKLQYSPAIELEARLLSGDSYFRERTNGTSRGFIVSMYRDVVRRDPHPAEVEHWYGVLRAVGSRELLAHRFLSRYAPELAPQAAAPATPPTAPPPSGNTPFGIELPPPTPQLP